MSEGNDEVNETVLMDAFVKIYFRISKDGIFLLLKFSVLDRIYSL